MQFLLQFWLIMRNWIPVSLSSRINLILTLHLFNNSWFKYKGYSEIIYIICFIQQVLGYALGYRKLITSLAFFLFIFRQNISRKKTICAGPHVAVPFPANLLPCLFREQTRKFSRFHKSYCPRKQNGTSGRSYDKLTGIVQLLQQDRENSTIVVMFDLTTKNDDGCFYAFHLNNYCHMLLFF